ncbi:MAG: ferritin [Elusimicrobiota bacterium]|nr:ferritin [Elusimicrobiota bacterium]
MKLSENIQKELNAQLNRELFSAYLYLSMAAYFEKENLKGFAHWFKLQAKEEVSHAMKFFEYIIERNAEVELTQIDKPKKDWAQPLEALKDTYEHEQKVTDYIHKILDLAIKEKDYATQNFLQWFVAEQVEEEAQALEILQKLEKSKDSVGSLFVLDHHLGKRE